MTKKIILLLAFAFAFFQMNAQWHDYIEPSENYVFADSAFVRTQPTTVNSPITDTLFAADLVQILKNTEQPLTLKGFSCPWVYISYKKDSVEKNGYLWSGVLAFNALRRGDTKFVCGVTRITSKDTLINGTKEKVRTCFIGIKAFKNGSKVASFQSGVPYYEEMFHLVSSSAKGSLGLKNIENIVSVEISGEACDIPADTYYFGFRGNEIVPIYNIENISSAGVYYHEEKLIFPAEKGGKENTIIWKMEAGESTEKADKNNDIIYKKTNSRKELLWEGEKATTK